VALSVILTAQLVPAPPIESAATDGASIATVVHVPDDVDALLRRSCYDCHSNATVVPWYAAIQPVKGWIAGHVQEGRRELNFDTYARYRPRRQYVKLDQIAGEVRSEAMPLPSYLWMHGDARLSEADRTLLYGWVRAARAELEARYPPDSLTRRR
jgi:hypothetical protein